jgi:chitinase
MFVVTRSGDLAPQVLVDYTTQDGTGPNGAHAGIDYVANTGTLVFAPYQVTATISAQILGNNIFQADKTFTVSLSHPVPGVIFAPPRKPSPRAFNLGP